MRNQQEKNIRNSISIVGQKMDLINYQNIQPPYLLQTLSLLRKTHLQQYLHITHNSEYERKAVMESLWNIREIIQNLDEKQFQKYSQLLIEPYLNKMKRQEWEIDGVSFQQIEKKYHLKKEVNASIFWAICWFLEVERMQDLFSRVELYYDIQLPDLMSELRKKLSSCVDTKNDAKTFITKLKRILSSTLKKTSQIISSPLITGIISSALLITITLLQNSTIPLQMKLNAKCFIPAGLVAVIPSILNFISYNLDKSDTKQNIRTWQKTFINLTSSLQKFNNYLQKSIKLCSVSRTFQEFLKEITNLQKLISSLTTSIEMVTQFDEDKFDEIRKRTQGYFKQYMEVVDGEWVIVIGKQEELRYTDKKYFEEEEQFQLLKSSKQLPKLNNTNVSEGTEKWDNIQKQ